MSSINPKKMKVAELKKELESRDIVVSKNMKKADLMALLISSLESETGHEKEFSSSEAPDDSAQSEPEGADSSIMDDEGEDQTQEEDQAQEEPSQDEGGREEESFLTANDETEPAQDIPEEVEPAKDELAEPQDETAELPQHEDEQDEVEQQSEEPPQPEIPEAELKQEEQAEEPMTENQTPQQDSVEDVPTNEETNQDPAPEETENPEQKEESTPQDIEMPEDAEAEKAESGEGEKTDEQKMTEENGDDKPENKDSKDDYHEYARKRRHDDRYDRHSRWEDKFAPPEEEPIEEFDDELVVLDIYNSDLNFKITRDRTGGQPLTMEGFAYLWGGARATYGVKSGKVCFECKILEEEAVKHLPSDEPHPRVVRVGWSTDKTGLQLGEEAFSYGYGGTGKSSADCKFNDFGETFHEGDVIGCYVNFEQEDKIEISYTKNGTYLGVAFTEEKEKLEDALFPHVLCKNTSVEINFGQKESQFFDHPEELSDYTFIGSVPLEDRVRAQKAPEARKDCEVLMMCGLPGAGKTYFAKQKIKESPEKKYNILGTNAIMDKMKVMGVARKRNYAGRWELLIQNATQCLNRLFQIACRKRRNYILDQTNVYASAQRRKMRPFEGFQRKAIVIVPSDEEYKQRFEKRTQDEGKEVPEMAVLEMKANFSLPEEGNSFDEVIFTELDKQEAEKLVEKYREDGRKNGPPPEKRSRGGDRSRSHGGWRQRDNYGGGPPMSYGNRGGWGRYGGGGPMGYGRGGYGGPGGFRGGRGGGFGGRGGGGGYGNRGYDGGRDFNRRDGGRRDNRSGGGGGGGGKRGGWQQNRGGGYGGGRGGGGDMYGGYNKHNQGRGGGGYRNGGGGGAGGYQNRQGGGGGGGGQNKFQGNNNTHPSAQTYTYGHHPNQQQQQQSQQRQQPQQQQQQQQQQMQNYANYGMQGYNYQQPNAQQQQQGTNMQAQQQGYQQQYGQQDYSQQWAQYYQAQQNQQYQNYYANYQQYYNQQAAAAQQQQQQPAQK